MRADALRPSGFFAFRVPALPLSLLTAWSDGGQHDQAVLRPGLAEIAARPDVQRALSVASPDLLDALHERPEDPGVEAALIRYVSRMASRPTPYGTFAACGTGVIDDETRLDLPDPATWRTHTQLDADYLDALIRDRWRRFRHRLTFRPNDSLHLMAGRWRYVQSRLDGLERNYHLLQVADSKHLQRALDAALETATLAEVADAVAGGGVDPERAARYAEQLVDAQILIPTFALTITGPLPLDALIRDLLELGDEEGVRVLTEARAALASLDSGGTPARPAHDRIAAQLAPLPVPIERSRLFHAQVVVPPCDATLARSTVDHIARGVELLHRFAPARPSTELDAFRDAFRDRYDQQEVPLLEALDEELGVGFGTTPDQSDPAPLLDGLHFPASEQTTATFGERERRLLELLHRAWSAGATEVELTAGDVEALARDDAPPLPAAVGAVAVLARTATAGGLRVVVHGATGPSGARLLGRFCHADPELADHVGAHLRAEEALDPEAIHAEIVHLPAGRLVNVLARPVLRRHEIEWLGRSGAPRPQVLAASDLLLSLRDDRFVLRSRALGRRVLPRLTSAHNYSRHSPGVYRFLAQVQADGCLEHVGWTWFPFDRAPFTPRLRRGPIVLALARWRAGGDELGGLDDAPAVTAWRERRRLPRWVCLVDGDNVLPFDLDNPLMVDAFVRTVRRRDEVVLEELLPGPDELVANGPDGHRALELVVPLLNTTTVGTGAAPAPARAPSTKRTFPPGSEWTYLKLATGSATADRLLCDEVGPCVRRLLGAGAADRWFFLRYSDPAFHLRLRVHGDAGAIRTELEALATRALEEGLATDATFGTYQREVERYGGDDGILVAERLFHADSEAVLDLLGLFDPGDAGLDARWRIGLLGADRLLRDLGLDEASRAELCGRTHHAFEQEMHADARLRKDVARKLRSERAALDELLDAAADGHHPLSPGIRVLAERSERITPLASELAAARLAVSRGSMARSFVHLWLNRLCRSEARRQEYVTYALLARLYESRRARSRPSP